QPTQPAAAQVTSDAARPPPAFPSPLEKPAASASAPVSINPGGSTPPLPRIKPQRGSVNSGTADQPIQQSAQKRVPQGSPASSIRETPAPQADLSSQTSDQGATGHASVRAPVWPDPPVATVKMPEPIAPPSDTRMESTPPTADARASNDADSAAQSKAST